MIDYTNSLPDECLTLIFNFLTTSKDRNNSSLVSHRWLRIEAQTHTHLTLYAHSNLRPFILSIFTRFNSLTHLVLRNSHCTSLDAINDNDVILITSMCPNLTCLKLHGCGQLTDSDNSSQLEVLSFRALHSLPDVGASAKFRPAKTLKVIELKNVPSERLFGPLISASKNLKSLKLVWGGGNWDRSLEMIPDDNCLAEVHLENVSVSDVGVSSLAKCRDLIALHIDCSHFTDVGLISVAENCRALRKLNVGYWKHMSNIGDEGLIAVGMHSENLEELVLNRVKATCVSLQVIATNCQNLVSLELSGSETITDVEMICIALKKLCIDKCHGVSNKGIEAFALGCPNLAEIRVIKCYKVTREVKDWLIARRGGQFKCMYQSC